MPIGSFTLNSSRRLVVLNLVFCITICTIYVLNYLVFQYDMNAIEFNIWRLRKQLQFIQGEEILTKLHNPNFTTIEEHDSSKSTEEAWKISKLMHLWKENLIFGSQNNTLNISLPMAPHLVDCQAQETIYELLDNRNAFEERSNWSLWKGHLCQNKEIEDMANLLKNDEELIMGPNPPWIDGGDEDNLPMTRRVQQDLWIHQHPKDNCQSHTTRYFLVDWLKGERLGVGAQLNWIAGMFALAIQDNRILVIKNFNRADHSKCIGEKKSQWSCYFHPETSLECRARAFELESNEDAWSWGYLSNTKIMETQWRDEWLTPAPKKWGEPWLYMQPTIEIKQKLFVHQNASNRIWWRAQAIKYLMRFPSAYMCSLMNQARHEAFGEEAAKLVIKTLPNNWPNKQDYLESGDIEDCLWTFKKPWMPRPILSIHVRIGDKRKEMPLFPFKTYMALAKRIQTRFPEAQRVWLSTEMQSVIDSSKKHNQSWTFYYTNVYRQRGHMQMGDYETRLGREKSTNNAFVNLLMAADADFFVGALGSTWCTVIDGLRSTGGKIMAGYLSVNSDRTWYW